MSLNRRTAILGIGNELRGDDAAGLFAARRLKEKLGDRPDVLVLETGTVPENFTGSLRRFSPEQVILLDAALMGAPAGTVLECNPLDAGASLASTHSLPLRDFARYLMAELNCRVLFIGIQPEHDELDAPLSPVVETAITELAQQLLAKLQGSGF